MRAEDRELLSRVSKVNGEAGALAIRILSDLADDDALAADLEAIGRLYTRLGEAFTARSIALATSTCVPDPLPLNPNRVPPGRRIRETSGTFPDVPGTPVLDIQWHEWRDTNPRNEAP